MAGLALAPFGKEIVPISSVQQSSTTAQLPAGTTVVSTVSPLAASTGTEPGLTPPQ
jgi:hypothetical protein